jgi:hypothetical protein
MGIIMERKEVIMKFVGIDGDNRPVFKDVKKQEYFGSVDTLFSKDVSEEDVFKAIKISELVYFGNKFGCEPMGTRCPDNEDWMVCPTEDLLIRKSR